ncbi:hypothetical protein L3556_04210 [Candidatus Synechococcus calcipolaris G9]|uniref:Uncharacterized protein n=1 Tax=Candidatus Synechococcus calcipolaris G9 TaxID=1497997 RepID=A0ABT6EXP7_9SYNE|nr:hypothetical protein [Candidatus Synechococcus calcipolaris]MDG2990142.1 hypothetical protein [Candidatus Synechococcus calcipolaris G9]
MNFSIPLLVTILALVSFPLLGCNTTNASDDRAQSQDGANGNPQVLTTAPEALENREDYDEINLEELPADGPLVGVDPEALAVAVFMPPVPPEEAREVRPVDTVMVVNPSRTDQAIDQTVVVVLSRVGLLDDSVRGIRYRVELQPTSSTNDSETPEWQMVWAGRQYLCQPMRGSQDWSSDLCS